VLNAVAASGRSNILATPHIIATDNVAAKSASAKTPLQTNVGGGASALSASRVALRARRPRGLLGGLGGFAAPSGRGNKIKVTPHINESNQVRLEIDQEQRTGAPPARWAGQHHQAHRQHHGGRARSTDGRHRGLMSDEYTTSRTKVPVLGIALARCCSAPRTCRSVRRTCSWC